MKPHQKNDTYDHLFKLLLIGDSGVGKSSLLVSFTENKFTDDMTTTIGVDFKVKYVNVRGKRVKLVIWDTAGQERFRTLTSSYYRGAQGIILIYDITNRESFDNLKNWLKEVNLYATYTDTVKLLVGNKIDLEAKRQVSEEAGEQFASENGMLFIEASAKTRTGVEQAFDEVAHQIMDTEILLFDTTPVTMGSGNQAIVSASNLDEQNEGEEGVCCGWL
jgi:Ras-related protein Rab-18